MSLGLGTRSIVDQLLEILDQIRRQSVAIFLVEQDVFAAFSIADRGYVMETGRIVRAGTAAELAKDPAVRAAYLGIERG
jgi:ABC-type branched-chain amino acid transport systems, ATPase component